MPSVEGASLGPSAPPRRAANRRQARPVTRRRTRRRVQLDLLPEVFDRVVAVQEQVGLDSPRDVFRQAFRVYEWYVSRRSQGWNVQLTRDDRVVLIDLGLDDPRQPIQVDDNRAPMASFAAV